MDLGFKGKVALVTGAGSQVGFGKEKAVKLLSSPISSMM
jgi:NAD(P)-dependent dehydrogenase (short-subunit alcohol dehydrogenase family)